MLPICCGKSTIYQIIAGMYTVVFLLSVQCKIGLTGLLDSYGSWHLYICHSLFSLSTFLCSKRVYEGHFMLGYKEEFLVEWNC